MFTGIVQGIAEVIQIKGNEQLKTFHLRFPNKSLSGIQQGASIAINGTCLTVTEFDLSSDKAYFDVINETLKLTNLDSLTTGSRVNFERAAAIGDEIGGHLMSGHIHDTAQISQIEQDSDNCTIYFTTPPSYLKYLLSKGFVGLNGCSLTLGKVEFDKFCVHLIPETLNVTTFGSLKVGDNVNLEIDSQTQSIVDTVERVLANRP